MTTMRDILLKLSRREDLTRDEAREAFELIMSGQASEAQIGGLLVGLASKGSTAEELIGAATVMRDKAVPVGCARGAGGAGGAGAGAGGAGAGAGGAGTGAAFDGSDGV